MMTANQARKISDANAAVREQIEMCSRCIHAQAMRGYYDVGVTIPEHTVVTVRKVLEECGFHTAQLEGTLISIRWDE